MNTQTFANGLTVTYDEKGSGRPILVLHGGAGPQSVAGLAQALSEHTHVIAPTHPGFGGTPRPDWFDSVDDLALAYLELLEKLDLHDVMVIGSSIGGWIAAELAVRAGSLLSSLVLIDATGIQVDGHKVVDVFTITPDELSALSFHNPAAFRIDPSTLTPEQIAGRAANFRALDVYSRNRQSNDPKLRNRLSRIKIPTLVVWGESDKVVTPDYGRAYAESIPNARFELISEAGHLPQFEQPQQLLKLLGEFSNSVANPA
jgi:pimeloyl-ACP methyl ester carboxylesterase